MGIRDRKGSLQKGKDADILLIDKNYDLRGVIAMGKIIKPIQ
jgi:N-acetylglucosamine-6-phosphate deacetylase